MSDTVHRYTSSGGQAPSRLLRLLDEEFRRKLNASLNPRVSRRAFIGGSGGLGLLALPFSPVADSLVVRWQNGSLVVSLGGSDWVIDPSQFAPGARVRYRNLGDTRMIRLQDARLIGMSVRLDLVAILARKGGDWKITLNAPRLGVRSSGRLKDWLDGSLGATGNGPAEVVLGRHLTASTPACDISLDSGWTCEFRAKGRPLRISAGAAFDADRVSLRPQRLGEVEAEALGATRGVCAAVADIDARNLPAQRCGRRSAMARFDPLPGGRVRVAAAETAAGRNAALLFEGPGSLALGGGSSEMRFDNALVAVGRTGRQRRMAVVGRLADDLTVNLHDTSSVFGPGDELVSSEFRTGAPASLSVRARLKQFKLHLPDGAILTVSLPGRETTLNLGSAMAEPTDGEEIAEAPPGDAISLAGGQALATLDLDGAGFRLQRGKDLFSLDFSLTNYRFALNRTVPRLPRLLRKHRDRAAFLTVTFPSQHIAEEWAAMASTDSGPDCPIPDRPTRSRLAAPSKIVFALDRYLSNDRRVAVWSTKDVTIEELTDWSDLDMVVDPRAMSSVGVDPERQLTIVGIDSQTSLSGAISQIAQSFREPVPSRLDAGRGAPEATALELHSRLVFSPSEKARWITPQSAPRPGFPIWNARLDENGRASLRALWSRFLKPGEFPGEDWQSIQCGSDGRLYSIADSDHWQIVGQTSTYGLPARRRVTDAGAPPPGNIARGGVYSPPDGAYRYLAQVKNPQDAGIAIATPFERADVAMTALGASFQALWRGDPPTILEPATGLAALFRPTIDRYPSGFKLEKLAIETYLGRDIEVESVTKGYLYPLGVAASFVGLVERNYVRSAIRDTPVASLVKRTFIVIQKPEKTFPAVNQPFDGRQFATGVCRIITVQTPDILDPLLMTDESEGRLLGCLGLPSNSKLLAFWPVLPSNTLTLAGTGSAPFEDRVVRFKWALEDEPTPAVAPFMFVDKMVASDPIKMAKLAAYYGDDERRPLRNAAMGGARRRYAVPREEGDTSFDSDSWDLGVTGRVLGTIDGDLEDSTQQNFDMDGRMEGADQPPFYPTIRRARIVIQTADRLAGRPLGQFTVALSRKYIEYGFREPNKGELYLEVRDPLVLLDMQGNGAQSGGIARPTSYLAGLSRKSGLVGAQERAASSANFAKTSASFAKASLAGAGAAAPARGELSFDFDEAQAGAFNPASFFKGATLLGILPLADVIGATVDFSKAPKLLQTFMFGPGGPGADAMQTLRNAARRLERPVEDAFNDFEVAASSITVEGRYTFPALYPEFWASFKRAEQAIIQALRGIQAAATLPEVAALASPAVLAARALIPEFERIGKDPVPPQACIVLETILALYDTIRNGFASPLGILANQFLTLLKNDVFNRLIEALDGPVGRALLGRIGLSGPELLADPGAFVEQASQALFEEQFARPMRELMAIIGDLNAAFKGQVALSGERFEREWRAALGTVTAEIGEELGIQLVLDPGKVDVRVQALVAIVTELRSRNVGSDAEASIGALRRYIPEAREVAEAEFSQWRETIPDSLGEPLKGEVFRRLEARLRAQLDALLWARLIAEAERVDRLIAEYRDRAIEAGLNLLVTLFGVGLDSLTRLQEFGRTALAASGIGAWCDSFGRTAKVLAVECLGATADIATHLHNIVTELTKLDPQGSATLAQLRKEGLEAAQSAARVFGDLSQARGSLDALAGSATCRNPDALLAAVTDVVDLRKQAVGAVQRLAAILARIGNQAGPAQAALLADGKALLLTGTAILVVSLEPSDLAQYPQAAAAMRDWKQAKALIRSTAQTLGNQVQFKEYAEALVQALTDLENGAKTIRQAIEDAPTLADIAAPALAAVDHVAQREKVLIAKALQSGALRQAVVDTIAPFAARGIKLALDPVFSFHDKVKQQLHAFLDQPSELLRLLLHEETVIQLQAELVRVDAENALLSDIAMGTTDSTVLAAGSNLARRWRAPAKPAILALAQQTVTATTNLLQGNLAAIVIQQIQSQLRVLEQRLREVIAQFVPVGVKLDYSFQSPLKAFPSRNPIFMMTNGPGPNDLVIKSEIDIDFLTGKRVARVTGTLDEFTIKLLGSIPIADIHFGKATFTIEPGQSPKFAVAIKKVQLNKNLEFIKPVQAWLSPGGDGLYLETIYGKHVGIEVGYRFSTGVISIGNVQFIDISFGVAARLYLDGAEAEFVAGVGTPSRPFAIACAPYGGVGFVTLVANARGIKSLELSFQMGAVTAIRFGPLNGYGRVTTGFGIAVNGQDRRIYAIVEAMGEGSVAFFSISIALRVVLVQEVIDGVSSMYGTARYSYKFKLGFIRYRYGVTARYTVKGKKSAGSERSPRQPTFAALAAGIDSALLTVTARRQGPNPEPEYAVRNTVPLKSRQWNRYRNCIAHELLEA